MTPPRSLVEREIRQTKPFASTAVVPIITLLRTANLVERAYNAALQPFGITLQQFNVLSILRGAEPHGQPMVEIGNRLFVVAPGVTRLLQKLEAKGLVRRQPGRDRRQVISRISAAGLEVLRRADPILMATDEALMAPLDDSDRRALVELLDRIRAPLIPSLPPEPEELSA